MFSRTDKVIKKSNPLIDALISTTVGDVREPAEVKFLRHNDKVSTLIQALVRHKYLSFPVADDEGEVLGVVDGADLIAFLQKQSPERAVDAVNNTYVLHLIDISQSNPYLPVFTTTSLHGVISILAPGCHRTVVFESEESTRIHAIFSETDLIRSLYRFFTNPDDLPNATRQKLKQFQSQVKTLSMLPIWAFAAHRSKPSKIARDTDSLSSAISHVLEFRRLSDPMLRDNTKEVAHKAVAEKGPSLSVMDEPQRAPLVAVFNESGILVGHLGAADMNHSIYGESVFASVSEAFGESRRICDSSVSGSPEVTQNSELKTEEENEKHRRSQSAVQTALSALRLTIAKYLMQYSPSSLGPIIVKENIPFVYLLGLLAARHKHHIWVLNDESEDSEGKSTPATESNAVRCDDTSSEPWLPYLVEGEVDGNKLQVLTLTDILRWVARDELTLMEQASTEGL